MSLLCRLGIHRFERREKNPHRDTDDGFALVCTRCPVGNRAVVWEGGGF